MSKTWEDRPLSKSKMALVEIDKQLEIIREDIKKTSLKNSLSLLEKIDVIEDWYALEHIVCNDMNFQCEKCPFLELTVREWDGEEYVDCHTCKFDFGSGYAGDIIPYIEKYRDRIDAYKKGEDDDEIHDTMEWRERFKPMKEMIH